MRGSEYRSSFILPGYNTTAEVYFDNLLYRRSRRNCENTHDHLIFCWDDEGYWNGDNISTNNCHDDNEVTSVSSRLQPANTIQQNGNAKEGKIYINGLSQSKQPRKKLQIDKQNDYHHGKSDQTIVVSTKEKNKKYKPQGHSTPSRLPQSINRLRSKHQKVSGNDNENDHISPMQKDAVKFKTNVITKKAKPCQDATRNDNSEKVKGATPKSNRQNRSQKRPLVVYGIGWKDNLCGSRRTFNVLSDNGVYKSALDALERRRQLKAQALCHGDKQQISREDQIQDRRDSYENVDYNPWNTSKWRTEYQRCYSA